MFTSMRRLLVLLLMLLAAGGLSFGAYRLVVAPTPQEERTAAGDGGPEQAAVSEAQPPAPSPREDDVARAAPSAGAMPKAEDADIDSTSEEPVTVARESSEGYPTTPGEPEPGAAPGQETANTAGTERATSAGDEQGAKAEASAGQSVAGTARESAPSVQDPAAAARESEPSWWQALSLDAVRQRLAGIIGDPQDQRSSQTADGERAEVADRDQPSMTNRPAAGGEPDAARDLEVAKAEPQSLATIKPTFDIVRVAPGGAAVIAGRGAPGAEVEIRAGERVIDRVPVGRRGHWVATPPSPLPPGDQQLSLAARLNGGLVESDQVVVVVVPTPPKTEVARREPLTDEALAVLMSGEPDDGGGRILQAPGRISSSGELTLMVVDYTGSGRVRLSGEAPPGAAVRIYVDNQVAGEVIADADGSWSTLLDDRLDAGTYTLRLDQLDASGHPVARLETPFSRVSQPPVEGEVRVDYVVVQPGNSLWRIARRLFGRGVSYVHIYDANRSQIRDPDLIYPGQVFEVPPGVTDAG